MNELTKLGFTQFEIETVVRDKDGNIKSRLVETIDLTKKED